MPNITVIGTGFAALTAVRTLRKLDSTVDITVIAPQPKMIYLPSLIWIPSGIRKAEDLIIPLDRFFQRMNALFNRWVA